MMTEAESAASVEPRERVRRIRLPGVTRAAERLERMSAMRLIGLALIASLVLTAAVEIAAAQWYRVTVQVVADGTLGINPLDDALDFGDMPPGTGQTRFVTLANDSGRPAYIMVLTIGGVGQLIDVDRSRFVLEGGQTAQVGLKLRVPPSAPLKGYSGAVAIFRLPYVSL